MTPARFAPPGTSMPPEKDTAVDALPSNSPDPLAEQAVIGLLDRSTSANEEMPQQEDSVPNANIIPQSSVGEDVACGAQGSGTGVANTGGGRSSKIMQPLKKRDAKYVL